MPPWRDGLPTRPRLIGLAAAGLAIALVMTPVSLPYFGVRQALDFERTARGCRRTCGLPTQLSLGRPREPPLLAAAAGALPESVLPRRGGRGAGRRRPGDAPTTADLAMAAVGVTGLLLSFGFSLSVAGREIPLPYALLYDYLPGARGLRDVARFGVLPLLALALLAAAGLGWLCDRVAGRGRAGAVGKQRRRGAPSSRPSPLPRRLPAHRWRPRRWRRSLWSVALAELASGSVRAVEVERDAEALAPYRWLAEQPRGLVIEFPADGVRGNVTRTTPLHVLLDLPLAAAPARLLRLRAAAALRVRRQLPGRPAHCHALAPQPQQCRAAARPGCALCPLPSLPVFRRRLAAGPGEPRRASRG